MSKRNYSDLTIGINAVGNIDLTPFYFILILSY